MMAINRSRLFAAGLALGLAGREVIGRLREADLAGQAALVTGGTRGLGFLLARALLDEGCRVAICGRDHEQLAEATRQLDPSGRRILGIPCDVSDRAQVDTMIDQVRQRFGAIDLLVNNAGTIMVGPVQSMTLDDFEQCMQTMFWGVAHPTLAVLPEMRSRGRGRIATITSIGGKVSVPHLLPYSCAKFAAVAFSEGLRSEVAADGVTVTTVVPGLMRTGSHVNAFFKGEAERELGWFSLGASLPVVSIDAERASHQIVRAIKRGKAEVTISMPALALQYAHAVAPGTVTDLLSLVDRVLPEGGAKGMERGADISQHIDNPLIERATSWGTAAAERFQRAS